jgi:hypothetical protein
MEYQLRHYVLAPGTKEQFVEEWRAAIVPLRLELGFGVLGAWEMTDEDEFAWIVSYSGEDGYAAAEERYQAERARRSIDPDPKRFITDMTLRVMRATDF